MRASTGRRIRARRARCTVGSWYEKMFPFGWNELAGGDARHLPDRLRPLSRGGIDRGVLRGPFGDVYARRFAGLQLEYRYSFLRDRSSSGMFHNLAGYGAINRDDRCEKLTFANAFGLGAHALIIDEFQLDAWYGVGWSSTGKFDHGAALQIRQAF